MSRELDANVTMVYCDCHSEAVQVSWWDDEELTFMSWWSIGHRDGKPPWLYRLKHIWHILTKGHPYLDDIVLSPEETQKLIHALQQSLDRTGTK